MKFWHVFTSAACLGVLPPTLYYLLFIAQYGMAKLIEPNLFILYGEIGLITVMICLASIKLFFEVRAYGKMLGAKDKWNREKKEWNTQV